MINQLASADEYVYVAMAINGLKDVDVRVNDYAEYISPKKDKENYAIHIRNFIKEHGIENDIIDKYTAALNIRSLIIAYGTKV